jgi:hypothetical protein
MVSAPAVPCPLVQLRGLVDRSEHISERWFKKRGRRGWERFWHDMRSLDLCTVILMYFGKKSTVYWIPILLRAFLIYVYHDVPSVILMYSDRRLLPCIVAMPSRDLAIARSLRSASAF